MSKSRKVLFTVIGLVFLAILPTFVAVSEWAGYRTCGFCDLRQEYRERAFFVLGAFWRNQHIGAQTIPPFNSDFPEHQCEHEWVSHEGDRRDIWYSPWVRIPFGMPNYISSRSDVIAKYNVDANFRRDLHRLLDSGRLSRSRLLELADGRCGYVGCSCLDGDAGDSALLNLVHPQDGEQAGSGQPATRPESKSEGGDKPQPESEGRSR
jgi:hypothetical protein